jgi:hypothetical protein
MVRSHPVSGHVPCRRLPKRWRYTVATARGHSCTQTWRTNCAWTRWASALTSSSSGTSSLRLHCERYTQFLGSALSQYDNEVNLLLMKMFADASRCRAELCEAVWGALLIADSRSSSPMNSVFRWLEVPICLTNCSHVEKRYAILSLVQQLDITFMYAPLSPVNWWQCCRHMNQSVNVALQFV